MAIDESIPERRMAIDESAGLFDVRRHRRRAAVARSQQDSASPSGGTRHGVLDRDIPLS
jgi:hypothetical protein